MPCYADLRERGIEAEGVADLAWGRFVFFSDPDGNRWSLQQLPDYAANAGAGRPQASATGDAGRGRARSR